MRRLRALTVAVLALFALEATATPAYAGGKGITASFDANGCGSQNTTNVLVELSQVPRGQRISIRTDAYDIVRGHTSYDGNVATYSVDIDAHLKGATTWVTDDAWNGSFRITSVSCAPKPTTPPPAVEFTTEPTTGNTTVPVTTTEPTAVPPAGTVNPGNPAATTTVTPGGGITLPGFPIGSTVPSPTSSASPSPSVSESTVAPSTSQTAAVSESPTAITLSGDQEYAAPEDESHGITTSVVDVVSDPVEYWDVLVQWFAVLLVIVCMVVMVVRQIRKS